MDEELRALAECFVNGVSHDDIAKPALLNRKRLDYSVASLEVVDDYLVGLHHEDDSQFGDELEGILGTRASGPLTLQRAGRPRSQGLILQA